MLQVVNSVQGIVQIVILENKVFLLVFFGFHNKVARQGCIKKYGIKG